LIVPVIRALSCFPDVRAEVIASAAHLSPFHGMWIEQIRRDGLSVAAEVESLLSSETWSGRALSFSNLVEGLTRVVAANSPDVLFVTGDREEALAGALVGNFMRITVAHLHGGDLCITSELDEVLRPAISKLSHLHFTATEGHRCRLIRMGEAPERVWATGGPGLDRLRDQPDLGHEALNQTFNVDVRKPFFLLIHHPSPLFNPEDSGREMAEILEGVLSLGHPVFCSYPNSDPGNMAIRLAIDEAKARSGGIIVYHTLPREQFVSLYRRCTAIVGNSSSIVIEAAFLRVPGILVGPRQDLREVGPNVLRVAPTATDVRAACLRCIEDQEFHTQVLEAPSIYGDGFASERIAKVLANVELSPELLRKTMTY
jgi:GDP/UDP-N,N'-diacetylbacillosamine 2-epimerase (hydrolysing)